ncbi:phosphopantetheine-binding protein [Streptomyces sp. NPDC003247]|uniref:phosphopantetheine-binding protein n=1 Tax=Streptomyces sp. NPDC003247 TaxID=3364677 RepID=UPI0036C7096B
MAHAATPSTPRDPAGPDVLATALAAAWQGVLGTPAEEDTDFYEAGGTSLHAARIAAEAAECAPDVEDLDVCLMTALLDEARFGDVRRLGQELIDSTHGAA